MKKLIPLLLTIALLASSQILSAADITGKVTLKGTPPPEKEIQFTPECAKVHAGKKAYTRHYVTSADAGLANVFVYLKEGVTGKHTPPSDVPVLDQEDCFYEPYVMGVMTGQKFIVQNSDPFLHNVNASITKNAAQNRPFNVGQPVKGMKKDVTYNAPEMAIRYRCDVHPWMFAYVSVLDHPFFAVTDKDGNYKIANVPPGKYTVEAYHVKTHGSGAGVSKEIEVKEDTKADFVVEVK